MIHGVDNASENELKIKFRESFRPFAPCVLREDADEYFALQKESPYMLLVAPVLEERRRRLTDEENVIMMDPDLRKRASVVRSSYRRLHT